MVCESAKKAGKHDLFYRECNDIQLERERGEL